MNQGHDVDSYLSDDNLEDYIGTTSFDLTGFSGTVASATLTVNHLASTDGTYKFRGNSILTDPAGGNYQGAYFGSNIWDVTSSVQAGAGNPLTYDRGSATFYKIPLAFLTVKKQGTPPVQSPVANFTNATPRSGIAPLTVTFTDTSTNTPTSWRWAYKNATVGWTQFATTKNPSFVFPSVGTYDINLTATNAAGRDDEIKTGYITVNAVANCDLLISGAVNTNPSTLFARESNTVRIINIKNNGPGASPATEVRLTSSDGFNGRATVPALASGAMATVSLIDTTVRNLAGGSVTYTAIVDPDNTVGETNEANNAKSSSAKIVTYNGYKGKRYWEGGSDVTTKKSFDLHGGLVYSAGNSVYMSGSETWTSYPVTWTAADLPIPAGATIREARLYVPYTWDDSNQVPDHVHIDFNNHRMTHQNLYKDVSNFGAYAAYVYGLLTYDVTAQFQKNAQNTVVFSRDTSGTRISPYGFVLAVVYEDSTATRKQIFINEEFDILGADETGYGTTIEEATAYVPFSGLTITPAQVSRADLITFVPSGNGPEGNLIFNGNTLGTNVWDFGSTTGTQVAIDTREVKTYLTATGNEAKIQNTAQSSPLMAASQQFLVVEYTTPAPVAGFTATPKTGIAPLTVAFTDQSTNTPTSWKWEYKNATVGWTQFATIKNPSNIFAAGTYDIRLNATNAGGSNTKTETGYITVNAPVMPPVADFTPATPFSVDKNVPVAFTDASTGSITSRDMDFGDGSAHGSGSGPWSHAYTTRGTYTVNLTVKGTGGSDFKTGLVTVKEPAPVIDFSGTPVSGKSPLNVAFTASNTGGQVTTWDWDFGDSSTHGNVQNPTHQYASAGTYTVSLKATGPDYSDTETKTGYIQVGVATIEVSVGPSAVTFGTMSTSAPSTGSTKITVTTSGGTGWSVTAADGKTTNKGHMVSGSTPLAGVFQLSNNGGTSYSPMSAVFTDFMTGSGAGSWNKNADVKQVIATADAPGDYAITITFTGAFS